MSQCVMVYEAERNTVEKDNSCPQFYVYMLHYSTTVRSTPVSFTISSAFVEQHAVVGVANRSIPPSPRPDSPSTHTTHRRKERKVKFALFVSLKNERKEKTWVS